MKRWQLQRVLAVFRKLRQMIGDDHSLGGTNEWVLQVGW